MDEFLADNERRAYRMALIATGRREDALEIVQDAMFKLVRKYAERESAEWSPLFQRIVQSTIRDWYRRSKVKNSLRLFFSATHEDESSDDMDGFKNNAQAEPDKALTQQQTLRKRFEHFMELPAEERKALRKRYAWFQNLPEDKREELKQRWQNISPEERQNLRQ